MSGWRFHYTPSPYYAQPFGAQAFKASNFRLDIVRFDVKVHSARMINPLHFNV
jgi:hypothetical protein